MLAHSFLILWSIFGTVILGHGLHRLVMLCRLRFPSLALSAHPIPPPSPSSHWPWPRVTVQLPLFNEGELARTLIQAVAGLDYPRERLEIQILDDSNDGSVTLTQTLAEDLRTQGYRVLHRWRAQRAGYKAGALREGLQLASGEFIAIFDADFLPPPDFLKQALPSFSEDSIGMVQCRWGHLNSAENFLTRLQQVFIDGHFLIDQEGRARWGYLFNFNGSAGIWRSQCITDAGNWEADTLTEDLDLSYRAQIRGWRFIYLPWLIVPAVLPATILAYKSQQHRWSKGSMQTARKLFTRILQSPITIRQKAEAAFHLLTHSIHPAAFAFAVLNLPAFYWVTSADFRFPESYPLIFSGMMGLTFLFLSVILWRGGCRRFQDYSRIPFYAAVSLGFSLHHTVAWLAGLQKDPGEFVRTPKQAQGAGAARPLDAMLVGELSLAFVYAATAIVAWSRGHWEWLPTLLLHCGGFGYVGWQTLQATPVKITFQWPSLNRTSTPPA
jgi:cellulose synthase/poly-beta-1,6-N-acetylglucosamine synthase-like glycosyltransferase